MDSEHPAEKSRKKNRRYLPELNFDSNSGTKDDKSADFWNFSSRFGSKKSSPDPENNLKHWSIVSEGFPPGVTVDELKNYGRRRQLSHLRPQDNLRLEEGSLKAYKSEYKRRFQAYAPLNLPEKKIDKRENINEEVINLLPEYRKSYVDYPRGRPILRRPQNNLFLLKDHPMEILTEKNSQYIQYLNYERRKLLRRSTALKPEGGMTNETEVRREYKKFKNPERAQMIRHLPSLRLEGEFQSMTTEQREKFIAYLLNQRPILEKKKTLLKMEGNFDFLTEKSQSYVSHELSARPPIRKRSTSLKLDGEVEFFPEYRSSFVDFPRTRPITYKPNENIRYEGELDTKTETKAKFVNYESVSIPESAKPENNLHMEGEMEISPEYRINFVDFPRERPFLRRPLNQLKPEGNLQVLTESSERFSNIGDIEKQESLRRPSNLRLEGDIEFLSENSEKFKKPQVTDKLEPPKVEPSLKLEGEMDFVTEKADKFGFLPAERNDSARRPSSLKLEGEFLFVPEYRNSYVDFGRGKSVLKPIQSTKSNPSSPIKKSKENVRFNSEDGKKSEMSTPRKKSNVKRLKEGSPEKSLKFKILDDIKPTVIGKNDFKPDVEFPIHEKPLPPQKEFSAFQVLDVKGQVGCQSLLKDVFEKEKTSSDDESSTYRLEVSQSGEKSPGFYKSNQRVFPNPALDSEELAEAERRARERAENFVKIVKSPEISKYILNGDDCEKENRWRLSDKVDDYESDENVKSRAFVVLDDCESPELMGKATRETNKRENWSPDWITSLPTI